MVIKDSFSTVSYKGEHIQTCYNRTQGCDEVKWNGKQYKSVSAAKVAITKSQTNKTSYVTPTPLVPLAFIKSPYRKGLKCHRRFC
jgi:hypothetical protein